MPRLFKILLTVEEAALGGVISRLQNTPGVIEFTPLLETKSAKTRTNGHAPEEEGRAPRKARFKGKINGPDFVIKLLKKRPMKSEALKTAFADEGRAPASIASPVHLLKNEGLIQSGPEGYTLTKKGRDRARYVK